MAEILTFADVAQRMESGDTRLETGMYVNRRRLEGTTISFFHFCE